MTEFNDADILDVKKELGFMDSESLKITRNTKGYNYEFRILPKEGGILDDEMIARAEDIKIKLEIRFNGGA